jgi:ATP-dependent Lon protease
MFPYLLSFSKPLTIAHFRPLVKKGPRLLDAGGVELYAEGRQEDRMQSDTPESGRKSIDETPILPVLPLRNTLLFPDMIIPLTVGRDRSLKAVEQATRGDGYLCVVSQKDPETEQPSPEDLFSVGVMARILRLIRVSPENLSVIVHGQSRVMVDEFTATEPFIAAKVHFIENVAGDSLETEALKKNVLSQYEKLANMVQPNAGELVSQIQRNEDPNKIVDMVAFNLNVPLSEKQALLEEVSTVDRLKLLAGILARELQVLELGNKIQSEVADKMSKAQRDYFLKEQMKAIQKELGEGDDRGRESGELKERIAKAKMSKEANEVALKEADRLAMMHPSAAEYTVSRTYIDWLIELPWSKHTKDRLDLTRAQKCLDEDHFGLEKVKERMLEYLAVQQLKKDLKGPILCLVGPPGVGKTSLGRSVARSLGRKFVRMSLGGIHDEAEIRGHRRTYVGALPGRVIQGMRKAGTHNPVFMLDELDKVGNDFRGDPTSALLEVLDPEQNFSFSDHYLEVPFDLSQSMFIATANILDTIPQPLLDRMEVIRIPGYTEEEKLHIATDHLLTKVLKAHGLTRSQLDFTPAGISAIISQYTRESGVRNLERQMASVCRKVARKRVSGKRAKVSVTPEKLRDLLGPQIFYNETRERIDRPGVSTGLAVTSVGGDILFIEAIAMPGRGGLALTGHLGEVMKESAQAALSWVKSHQKNLGLRADTFTKNDIHVHVPQGAIPKDGPSAGVAITTSLVSLLTGRPVRDDVAMTGEITLMGKVLPVGGIKEKVLAAKRAGILEVIIPEKNKDDLEDLTADARNAMTFYFATEIPQVLEHALKRAVKDRRGTGKAPKRAGTERRTRTDPAPKAGAKKKS